MSRVKASEITIGEARWLTKAQAMAWVNVKTEEVWNNLWRPYLNLYGNGGKASVYDKRQIDRLMEQRIEIKAQF
jgi:hypothetical protein